MLIERYIYQTNTINTLLKDRKITVLQIIKERFISKFNTVTNQTSIAVGDLNDVLSEDVIYDLKEEIKYMLNDYLIDDHADRIVYAIEFDINGYMVFYTYDTKGNPHAKS